jgi:hypothetical protein
MVRVLGLAHQIEGEVVEEGPGAGTVVHMRDGSTARRQSAPTETMALAMPSLPVIGNGRKVVQHKPRLGLGKGEFIHLCLPESPIEKITASAAPYSVN